MNTESRATLEIIAPSIQEAIDKGLAELGVAREAVDIEILDEGSKGLFGIGNRQVRIRLTLTQEEEQVQQQEQKKEEPEEAPAAEKESAPSREEETQPESTDYSDDEELENVRSIAQATVAELLEKMNIHRATIDARITPPSEEGGQPGILVEVLGDDLSILIGKRAETLDALQYITRLIVGKEVGRGINLTVDVEGYRTRREQNLRRLARRMASQAIKTGRRQMLEPMSAAERRLIHIELREMDEVTTESVGEEPRRKVTIIPTDQD